MISPSSILVFLLVTICSAQNNFWDPIPSHPSTTPPTEIEDNYWNGQFERVNTELSQASNTDMVFFGNSITWYWTQSIATGQPVWDEFYADYNPINMGNSGDITPVMIYRLTHGNLDFPRGEDDPKVAVVLAGTNNYLVCCSAGGAVDHGTGPNTTSLQVADGVRAIIQISEGRK